MKKYLFTFALLLILAASLLGPFGGVTVAQAQTCTDATGATVACPPSGGDSGSDDGNDDNSGGNGNPNPPASVNTPTFTPSPTPSPEPTNTPLPEQAVPTVVSPAPTAVLPFAVPNNQLIETCNANNGSSCWQTASKECPNNIVVLETDPTNATFGFFCIPADTKQELGLPKPGSTEGNGWEGHCLGSDKVAQQCIDGMIQLCISIGGQPSTDGFSDPDPALGWTNVGCNDIPSPGYGDTGGQVPSGIPWGPIGITVIIVSIILLIPAVQKVRAPASRNKPQTREHILLAKQQGNSTSVGDWDGDGDVDGRDFIQTSSNSSTTGSDGSGSGRDVIISRDDKDKE